MKLIPVIDLMAGQVVHACGGQREQYQPLASSLIPTSNPRDVIRGLMTLYRFSTVYVADLDAITGRAIQRSTVSALLTDFPELDFWVDAGAGMTDYGEINARMHPVLGSESHDRKSLNQALQRYPHAILSLDFNDHGLIGDKRIMSEVSTWPDRVIIMSLQQVGRNAGPDFERIRSMPAESGARKYYAAGGIRHREDMEQLQECGIDGVLVASALYNGNLSTIA